MNLTGLHILLTYTCNYECDHCFVWGSPWQTGVFTMAQLKDVLYQAREVGTITEIYFEGGEAFLYYPLLLEGVRLASALGFSVGIVSNGYWATSEEDACQWLKPLAQAGLKSIDVSSDLFHGKALETPESQRVLAVAPMLGLATGTITVDAPAGARDPDEWEPGLPLSGGGVMYRGRAAVELVEGQPRQHWMSFPQCPYENLENPGRIHLDPFGNLHLCQGIVIGNMFNQPLKQILAHFEPHQHPIAGPLISSGPTGLAMRYLDQHEQEFVDACHLCYTARVHLRNRFPDLLAPDQMYGGGIQGR
ncbi:MAG: radical SAM protein [Anaerolineales bacterium]|nr:radical SAM protein [Anaerolineales bacterium]